jgi:hypothetical protein
MDRFENKCVESCFFGGAHYSRIIASWCNIGGTMERKRIKIPCEGGRGWKLGFDWPFRDWLQSLVTKHLIDEYDMENILFLVDNGKLELEEDARKFIQNRKDV